MDNTIRQLDYGCFQSQADSFCTLRKQVFRHEFDRCLSTLEWYHKNARALLEEESSGMHQIVEGVHDNSDESSASPFSLMGVVENVMVERTKQTKRSHSLCALHIPQAVSANAAIAARSLEVSSRRRCSKTAPNCKPPPDAPGALINSLDSLASSYEDPSGVR
jgi:hypothetical protein